MDTSEWEMAELYKSQKTSDSSLGSFFPLARTIYPTTVGVNLVAVQPLSAPTGILYYLDDNGEPLRPIITKAPWEKSFEDYYDNF